MVLILACQDPLYPLCGKWLSRLSPCFSFPSFCHTPSIPLIQCIEIINLPKQAVCFFSMFFYQLSNFQHIIRFVQIHKIIISNVAHAGSLSHYSYTDKTTTKSKNKKKHYKIIGVCVHVHVHVCVHAIENMPIHTCCAFTCFKRLPLV